MLTIKLEGEIIEPWVGTLRDACSKRSLRSKLVRLDLAGVRYADASGVQLLRDLTREGIEITACSGFIDELLRWPSVTHLQV
jgi:ABC-type transporter Mla MlaB component